MRWGVGIFGVDNGNEGGGINGKYRFVEVNGNGSRGNDGGPWWKNDVWCWFKRLKRLRRRRNEPLSNIFSLAGSNVQ